LSTPPLVLRAVELALLQRLLPLPLPLPVAVLELPRKPPSLDVGPLSAVTRESLTHAIDCRRPSARVTTPKGHVSHPWAQTMTWRFEAWERHALPLAPVQNVIVRTTRLAAGPNLPNLPRLPASQPNVRSASCAAAEACVRGGDSEPSGACVDPPWPVSSVSSQSATVDRELEEPPMPAKIPSRVCLCIRCGHRWGGGGDWGGRGVNTRGAGATQ
jgi:hypothetical protein